MRLGMIFECCRNGADEKVYPYLAHQIRSDLEIIKYPLDSKGKLIANCGETAKKLLNIEKCERVMIVWDLYPSELGFQGGKHRKKENHKQRSSLCVKTDRLPVLQSLEDTLDLEERKKVRILSVQYELETLLLFDKQALKQYISKKAKRDCEITDLSSPQNRTEPKKVIQHILGHHGCWYDEFQSAYEIIQLVNPHKLEKCPPYQKFKQRILGLDQMNIGM